MRWIRKASEPAALINWRLEYKDDDNFGYDLMRKDPKVVYALVDALLQEQGRLCAYTGRRIAEDSCHIEHLRPQAWSVQGEDVDYRNMVACYPRPNCGWECPYGAHPKGQWPKPEEGQLFVSPLVESCEARFDFTYTGKIKPTSATDEAARKTIDKLKLDHKELTALRREAIRGALQPKNRPLSRDQAQRLLAKLETAGSDSLTPFEFAIRRALRNHLDSVGKGGKGKRT